MQPPIHPRDYTTVVLSVACRENNHEECPREWHYKADPPRTPGGWARCACGHHFPNGKVQR